MAKNMNPTKVITGKDTRWSYCNVWDAKSINGGTPKYSVSLIIPKSDTATVQKIRAAIEAAYRDGENKLRGNGKTVPPLVAIKNPLRDGDTEERLQRLRKHRRGEEEWRYHDRQSLDPERTVPVVISPAHL